MNAYELADYLEKQYIHSQGVADAISMLRQQAERLAELEKKSQPVAWMNIRTSKCVVFINTPPSNDWIPLYTTPQTKPLSDEEIEQIAKQHLAAYAQFIGAGEVCYEGEIEFARAIEERHGIK